MNKYFISTIFCISSAYANAQLINTNDAVKQKATNRANSRIDQSIDKGLDKAEEGIGNLFKKKNKSNNSKTNTNDEDTVSGTSEKTESSTTSPSSTNPSFTSYSKYDFLPGLKVVAYEDFSQDEIGDFPAKWNTNGSGEVVTISGKEGKWLKFLGAGTFYPEFQEILDENSTIEFDLATTEANKVMAIISFIDSKRSPNPLESNSANQVEIKFDPVTGNSEIRCRDANESDKMTNQKKVNSWKTPKSPFVKIALWRQKSRLRVYMNETKVWDIPRAFEANIAYKMLFSTATFFQENRELYVTNLRIAHGLPDTRSKLLTEGKLSTNGILFDTNSDNIKAQSYAILKEIGTVLIENQQLTIKIIGHTDSDGDDKSNMTLSKKRAEAVKTALTNNFNVSPTRMQTEGLGERKPIDTNDTPHGKANNRRVEFLKL